MSSDKPILIIECYDSGVRVCDNNRILAESTSCALIEAENNITVGQDAEHQAHLRPREISTGFWSKLSENSVTKHVVSNAELAFHHLQHVWSLANGEDQDVILIIPATLDKHDLGLLLGVCNKLSINVTGMVCSAALSMSAPISACKVIYLDLLQTSIVINELEQTANGVAISLSRIFDYGLENFFNNIAKKVAKTYVRKTRFDPLHSANDEQQFFEKLPLWLSMLRNESKVECSLSSDNKNFVIEIDSDNVQSANFHFFQEISAYLNILFHNTDNILVYCSSSCKKVFGMFEFLSTLPGCAAIQLEPMELAKHALKSSEKIINKGQILYVNSLPWRDNSTIDSISFNPGKLSDLASIPTHVLISNHAYSLEKELFISSNISSEATIRIEQTSEALCQISKVGLNVELRALNNHKIHINNEVVASNINCKTGDLLTLSGCRTHCQFIKVVPDET